MTATIAYGQMEGRYFTQWRIDLLLELLGYITDGFHPAPGVEVSDVKVWYDEHSDFHRMSFTGGGRLIEVRFYKVFACNVDGKDAWTGCPRGAIIPFAAYVRKVVRGEERPES